MPVPESKPIEAPRFAVVIPLYNEEAQAEECVRRVCGELSGLPNRSSLILVNDGSTDQTAAVLARMGQEHANVIVVEHRDNQGYGAALRTGIRTALNEGFDYALFMDSDLTNDPTDISKFAERMAEGFDVIKASRYSHGGGTRGIPLHRRLISRIGNLVAKALSRLPLWDLTNGFRAVKLNILERCPLKENNFSIIMEELYYCKYLAESFCHVPVVLTSRAAGQRGTAFTYTPSMFVDYLKYPLRSALVGNPFRRAAKARANAG